MSTGAHKSVHIKTAYGTLHVQGGPVACVIEAMSLLYDLRKLHVNVCVTAVAGTAV